MNDNPERPGERPSPPSNAPDQAERKRRTPLHPHANDEPESEAD